MLLEGILWNSSARIEKITELVYDEYQTKGNVTEKGLFKFFMQADSDERVYKKKHSLAEQRILEVLQFSSERKRATIAIRYPELEGTDREVRIFSKGAPDILIDYCSKVVVKGGKIAGIDERDNVPADLREVIESRHIDPETQKELLLRGVKKFAQKAFRTILVCYKDMSMEEYLQLKSDNNDFAKEKDREVLESDLTAYGVFGMQDPLRETIEDSIQVCKRAGIQVIMCTGDNLDTAIAISK